MGLLVKRPSSPLYYARFQVNGTDRWLSTKKTDRNQAQKALNLPVARARNTLSVDEQVAVLLELMDALPKDLQAVTRQEILRTVLRAQEKKVALEEAWKRWLKNSNKEYDPKPKTLLGYEAIFLYDVSADHAGEYAANLWQSKASASTYNWHIKFLRSLCNALELEAGLIGNPRATRYLNQEKARRRPAAPHRG